MQYMVAFSRSDAIYENEHIPLSEPGSLTLGPFEDYIQLTYASLRYGPEGDFLASYTDSGWFLDDPVSDRYPWSDVVIFEKRSDES